ncbi:hypothetical protein BpHYR1_026953 [Brachionus plicatilis]|uniref:Uncharacterized protein n=1 Tax=Brachionus plicatilis TaxID=10195 RepID=A0A3M7PJI6_BRAPC|nr:hypothetical protein BpHYR1_026953 [Brachionus plicatilis]
MVQRKRRKTATAQLELNAVWFLITTTTTTIEYQCKTMSQATYDIYNCLKESGELWYEAYNIDAITQVTRSDTTE